MARKASTKGASSTPSYDAAGPDFKGLALVLLSLLILLALFGVGPGALNATLARALRWLVGVGAYPLALLIGLGGILVVVGRSWSGASVWVRLLALELFFLLSLGLLTLARDPELSLSAAAAGKHGGVVGWIVASGAALLGRTGGLVALLLLLLLVAIPLFGLALERLLQFVEQQQQAVQRRRARLLAAPARSRAAPPPPTSRPAMAAAGRPALAPLADNGVAAPVEETPILSRVRQSVGQVTKRARGGSRPAGAGAGAGAATAAVHYELPPLELLGSGSATGLDPNIAREKARVIEDTLRSFGVPAQVVQVNQGPAVTQFGVQPGFLERTQRDGTVKRIKVKVSKITSLSDDIALALAARSIRMEAPVPGRPYVGIEVPNSDTEVVSLHSVLTSDEFRQIDSPLAFALGRDVSGRAVAADLARMPHMLIAGATGSGKSVCVNTIIASLLFNLGPDRLKLMMIDPKMVELIPYNGIPHLIAPVVTDMERVVGALTWAMREMDRRYKLFSEAGTRNIDSYNKKVVARGEAPLPYIVIIIDELADLMMIAADQVERIVCRIAQMARATGMHLILATQRPSVDVVTGLIKANVPARIAFAVASQVDSRVILDTNGAESLLGRGDMLFQAPDSSKLQRLQGCFVTDGELSDIVGHWIRYGNGSRAPVGQRKLEDQAPWSEIVDELQDDSPRTDDMLDQAIEIVREHQWASTSFLQRKLRIGYTRAARMIDALESRGVIGPPQENNSGSREVLVAPPEKAGD